MPPIKESTQQTAGASAPLDLPTQSDEVDPGLGQISATACISGTAAANAERCGWETQMENRMTATEQGMSAAEQRTDVAEQGIRAIEQRMKATEQLGRETRRELGELGRETRRELGEIRELLQAALPNAANVTAATAPCSQEAIMTTINTGIVGCLNVLPIEAQGIKFGVVTVAVHVRPGDGGNPLSMYGPGMEGTRCSCTARGWRNPLSMYGRGWREPAVHVRPGDGGNPLSMYGPGIEGTRSPCTARGWREPAVHVRPGDGGNPLSMYGPGMEGTRCPRQFQA